MMKHEPVRFSRYFPILHRRPEAWRRHPEACQLILAALLLACFFFFLHAFSVKQSHNVTEAQTLSKSDISESQLKDQLVTAELKALLRCKDKPLEMERLQYGAYWLVRNMVGGSDTRFIDCAATITFTTHGDYTFFESLATVVTRWLAPVSFAIFAPGYDLNATLESIQYVRQCLPESALIRQFVSFHLYFPVDHMPPVLPRNEAEALLWPHNCEAPAPYVGVRHDHMYKAVHNLSYPINVGRNIARNSANTHFIFACDIELFPNPGFVKKFLDMVVTNHSVIARGAHPRVFPIPVFELEKEAKLPNNKHELRQLLASKMAIPFHSKICTICHLVPNQGAWLNTTADDGMSVFEVVKRELKFAYWEPFYVSDNREPMFDERVTWEGQKNKRIQGFAMCLLEYEYNVLNDGFLVHSPGIKFFDKNSTRLKYVPPMNKLIKDIIEPEYKILYGRNERCRV